MSTVPESWEEHLTNSTFDCLICLSEINFDKDEIIRLDCFHSHCFHKECLGKTAFCCRNHNCPLCKKPYNPCLVDDTDIQYSYEASFENNTHNDSYSVDESDYSDDESYYSDDEDYFDRYLEQDINDYGVVIPDTQGWEDYGRTRRFVYEYDDDY